MSFVHSCSYNRASYTTPTTTRDHPDSFCVKGDQMGMQWSSGFVVSGNRSDTGPNPTNKHTFSATISSQKPGIVPKS